MQFNNMLVRLHDILHSFEVDFSIETASSRITIRKESEVALLGIHPIIHSKYGFHSIQNSSLTRTGLLGDRAMNGLNCALVFTWIRTRS